MAHPAQTVLDLCFAVQPKLVAAQAVLPTTLGMLFLLVPTGFARNQCS